MESGLLELGEDLNSLNFMEDTENQQSTSYRFKQIQFLKKIHNMKIPFGIKTLLRDCAEKVLKMPLFFDSLVISSLLECYRNNIDELDQYMGTKVQPSEPNLWKEDEISNRKLRVKPLIEISLQLKVDFASIGEDLIEEEYINASPNTKQAQYSENRLFFDLMLNIKETDKNLLDYNSFNAANLQSNIVQNISMESLTRPKLESEMSKPETVRISVLENPSEKCLELSPNLSQVKSLYTTMYERLLGQLSSLKSIESLSEHFNLFEKMMAVWGGDVEEQNSKLKILDIKKFIDPELYHSDLNDKIIVHLERSFQKIAELLP